MSGGDGDEIDHSDETGQDPSRLSFVKQPSMIEQKAYRDTWGKGLDSYLKWFYETVVLLRELLADDGSLYVHLDWRLSHYAKGVLDEVFGELGFMNEVIWLSGIGDTSAKNKKYIKSHDTILVYAKSERHTWNDVFQEYGDASNKLYSFHDQHGNYRLAPIDNPGGGGYVYDLGFGEKQPSNGYRMPKETAVEWLKQGILVVESGKVSSRKLYKSKDGVRCRDLWTDITGSVAKLYPTQKPEALLERIVKASSNPGDLVLDCFCGSGTTAAVAEKLGRRWITCDLGRFAIHTARKRLLGIEHVKPFVVQNLGKYERQQWQNAEFGDDAEAKTQEYRKFILTLYKARPITGYVWLHGLKNGHMVHIGGVDAPISVGDVAQVVAEFKRSRGTGDDAPTQNSVDILGWDFAFELNEVAKQQAALTGVDVKFVRIPREVLEKKAVEQGDIKFFELAALSVDTKVTGKSVMLTLKDFVIPLDDVPQEIQSAITHWEQWIDYWAVDWDNKGDTFHNQWQSYRTRQSKTIQRQINSPAGTYTEPGEYKVVVKVIDILGNDTTKTLKITIV